MPQNTTRFHLRTSSGVVSSYPHEGLMLAAGRLSMLGPDATRRDVGRAVGVEIETRWEVFLVLYVCTEVVFQLYAEKTSGN